MKFRFASALLALALPICAQDADSSQVEAVFYKAYYLEKGQRDFAGAMALYESFLNKAPKHKLAKEAAKQQFRLLDRTGKTEARDAFKAKYKDLLGNIANAPSRTEGGRPERGERGEGGRGEGGQRRRGGRSRGVFGLLRGDQKFSEMSEEQLKEVKDGIEGAGQMIDRMRERMGDEMADKIQSSVDGLKKALDAGKMEEAQKALEGLRESFGGMRGRGRGQGRGGEGRGEGGTEGRRRRREGGGGGGAGGAGGDKPKAGGGGGKKKEAGGGGR